MRRHRNRSMSFSSLEEMEAATETTTAKKETEEEEEEEYALIDTDLPTFDYTNGKLSFLETEQKMNQQLHHVNECYRTNGTMGQVEGCIELVCSCIKEALYDDKILFNNSFTYIRSYSVNCINELRFRDLINNMIKDTDYFRASINSNLSANSICSVKESIRDILFQNIEIEGKIKVLVCSNNNTIKNKYLSNFLDDDIPDDYISKGLEIRQRNVNLMSKKISVEFFDTEEYFFTQNSSEVYFKIANSFFVFCDLKTKNVIEYVKDKSNKYSKYLPEKKMIVIEVNAEATNRQTHNELKFLCLDKGIILIPIKNEYDFDIKYHKINSLFKILLIKKKKTVKTNLCLVKEKEELIGDRLNFDSDYKLEKTSVNVKLNRKYIRKWSL